MNKPAFLVLVTLMLIGGGCLSTYSASDSAAEPTIDRASILVEARENGLIMDEAEVSLMAQTPVTSDPAVLAVPDIQTYLEANVRDWSAAALADVTGGDSFGIAHSRFASGTYTLVAEMGNLPDPAAGYFYEGWLVRRGEDFSLVSTGRVQKTDNGYAHVYLSTTDLSGYDFYVLTLEPDDANPAPAEHILEGTLK
ncbi:hypothetical protein HY630_01325 [Candidatus Uhrbacteria bacterium]|nr:hypothetical protein [Candidatus Uhrbacteria bacterium]